MNILLLNHNQIGIGTFNRASCFGRYLARRGHNVTVVTNSRMGFFLFKEYTSDGIRIIESPDLLWGHFRTGWDPVNVLRRILYFRKRKFDLIQAFDCRPTVILPALYLKKSLKIPLVIDWADWWGRGGVIELRRPRILYKLLEPIETFFEENFRKYADYTTAISEPLKERAIGLGIDKNKISVLRQGCDVASFAPLDKNEARKKLDLPQDKFILLFSGFTLYDVDIKLVMDSFSLVLQREKNTLLILTGSPKMLESKRNHKEFRENPNVLYFGFLSKEKYNLVLGATDLCLIPLSDTVTNQARFPGRMGDYMSAGRPVVSNDVGDGGVVVRKYNIGILTNPDPKSFSDGIIKALKNPVELERWGRNARNAAEKELSFEASTEELENIYLKLLKNP